MTRHTTDHAIVTVHGNGDGTGEIKTAKTVRSAIGSGGIWRVFSDALRPSTLIRDSASDVEEPNAAKGITLPRVKRNA